MSKKRKETRLTLRVYSDTDPEVYAWLTSLDEQNLAHGAKLQKVRETLLAGLRGGPVAAGGGGVVTAAVDVDGLADRLLAQMRPVVEAAVTSALQGLALGASASPAVAADDDGAFADDLVDTLMR